MIAPAADQSAMNFLGRLSRRHQGMGGHSLRMQKQQRRVQASYDAAATTELNKKYWDNADLLSADAANAPEIRATLRSRARYECFESNGVMKGMVRTLARDTIGSGPTLQMLTKDTETNRAIEKHFQMWANEINLPRKLRTMRLAKCVDGEAFAMFTTSQKSRSPVSLDLKTIEADMVATPIGMLDWDRATDGIEFDDNGDPTYYHLLKAHPGGPGGYDAFDYDRVKAENVIHMFAQDRPGQHRGIPEVTPALPLCALLRDYILAVLHNARSSAKFTAVLETIANAVNDESVDSDVEAFDFTDIDYDMMTSLPFGWKLNQLQPAHPIAKFDEFVRSIFNQIARCIDMPLNVALANSAGYNYASGRLDHQTYFFAIDVERSEWDLMCLDRILQEWFDEAVLIPGLLPPMGSYMELPHQWFWMGRGHVDRSKESKGQETELANGTTHRAREYAKQGLDVDVEDQKAADALGMTVEQYRQRIADRQFGTASSGAAAEVDREALRDLVEEILEEVNA